MQPSGNAVASGMDRRAFAAGVPVSDRRPRNLAGAFYTGLSLSLTASGLLLSSSPSPLVWLAGQILLAIAFLQWFAVLHEAGHKTLFRSAALNRGCGYLAGFAALMPADCWRCVHAKHHYWTGWQDLDVTTQALVPRRLHWLERCVINTAWRLWIPLFATLYRWNNYWNLLRLWRIFPEARHRRLLTANVLVSLILYTLLIVWLGPIRSCQLFAVALLASFAVQDLLILSQHTHIPMKLAHGRRVDPFPPKEQSVFTRSLLFPVWFSRLILLNFDAHELHHMYPAVPGYDLHRFGRDTANAIRWWEWFYRAKVVPGDVLLFQNRDQTGFYF